MTRNNSHLRSKVPFVEALSTIGAALLCVGNVSFTLSPLRCLIGASVIPPFFGPFHFGASGYSISAEEAV